MGTLTDSEDPDEMQHNAACTHCMHCLLRLTQPSGTEIHYNLKTTTCDPLKYKWTILHILLSLHFVAGLLPFITLRIYHEYEGGIEKSVPRITICHRRLAE